MNSYAMYEDIQPLLNPQDIVATATGSAFVKMGGQHRFAFLVHFGTVTPGSAGDAITVTVEAATTGASGSEAAVAFNYRKSGIASANTWGAVTAATSSGFSFADTDDGKLCLIEIDPAAVLSQKADASHVRAVITPAASYAACVVGVTALKPRQRYLQLDPVSST